MLGRDFRCISLNVLPQGVHRIMGERDKMAPRNEVNAIIEKNIENYISMQWEDVPLQNFEGD